MRGFDHTGYTTITSGDDRLGCPATANYSTYSGTVKKIEKYQDGSEMIFVEYPSGAVEYSDAENFVVRTLNQVK